MSFTDTPDFRTPNQNEHDSAVPRFFIEAIQNGPKSDAAGRPIFDDVEHVEILVPGDRGTVWSGRVTEKHRQRFARQYANWKAKQDEPTEGTPLKEWAAITRGQAEELAYSHVKTVEQLAALSDDLLNKSVAMGGFALREKARRFLEQAKGAAPADALAAENEALKGTMTQMQEAMAAMKAQIDLLSAAKTNGSGE